MNDIREVRRLLLDFAERTGVSDTSRPPRRYLWTDAHAVCTLLSLYRATGDVDFRRLAVTLIDQVHEVLGKYAHDDPRDGWISGLDEADGRNNPTVGGLRIGKTLLERAPGEPVDERLEWERDGQYFHYLTKWMHALCRARDVTANKKYGQWAFELARAAHAGFVFQQDGSERLRWKMSVDLSRPQLPSSGQHDPLDGYVTFLEVAAATHSRLQTELDSLAGMVADSDFATSDPLGIGGLLFDACRLLKLTESSVARGLPLVIRLVLLANHCLRAYAESGGIMLPATRRLAFRELGLTLGLHGAEEMARIVGTSDRHSGPELDRALRSLNCFQPLAAQIETFWRRADNQVVDSWREHADINAVTLATSLLPTEYLAA